MDRAGYLPHGHAHVIVDAPRMTHDTPRARPRECRAQRGEMLSKTPLAFEARLSPGGLASWAVPPWMTTTSSPLLMTTTIMMSRRVG